MSVQHDLHDELLIARLAGDDIAAPERAEAERLIRGCEACASLFADLRSIIADVAALPAPARPRDFRLTPTDAARLRPAGFRGWLARFGTSRFSFAGPLGAALATLGLAGILVSGATAVFPQSGSTALLGSHDTAAASRAAAPVPAYGQPAASAGVETLRPPAGQSAAPAAAGEKASGPGAIPSPAPSSNAYGSPPSPPGSSAPAATPMAGSGVIGEGSAGQRSGSGTGSGQTSAQATPPPPGPSVPLVPIASIVLLVAGLALLGLRRLGT